MNRCVVASIAILVVGATAAASTTAPVPATLRVDVSHAGNATTEHFALERVVVEPLPWPDHPQRAIDSRGLGKYRFEVVDPSSGTVVFSRGFSSIYGEWETTAEARELDRAFGESLRFPQPPGPVRVEIAKRQADNSFRTIWSVGIDPADVLVDRSPPPSAGAPIALHQSGPPADSVDILFLGDGYTAAERGTCEADLVKLTAVLLATEPFRTRADDLNVHGLCPAATESGISRPSLGLHRRSPAGAAYDAFRSERYILSVDNRAWRDLAAQAPYEYVEIVTNSQTYGGGGIYGQFATVAARSEWAPYLLVHELAHHFAALADEYYTSDVAYAPATDRVEPWEANATALLDPSSLKWGSLVAADTPVPTPWAKADFEERSRAIQVERRAIRAAARPEAEMDALFRRQRDDEEARLGAEPWAGRVGAFEGANYEASGYYRPAADCIMFSRNRVPFCPVCHHALDAIINFHTGAP
jgi:hypothetical protein